jgi:hypothetical protein
MATELNLGIGRREAAARAGVGGNIRRTPEIFRDRVFGQGDGVGEDTRHVEELKK